MSGLCRFHVNIVSRYLKTGSWGEYSGPRWMRMGNGESSATRNFIVCPVEIILLPLSPWIHGLRSRKHHKSVAVTPAPVQVLTQRPLIPSLTSVVGYAVCCPDAHGAMDCNQKSFIILEVWQWCQLLFNSLSKGRLSRVSRKLGRKLFGPPSYSQASKLVHSRMFTCYHVLVGNFLCEIEKNMQGNTKC